MRTDMDYIISLMKEYTPKLEGELDELEEAPAGGGGASAPSTGGGGGGGNTTARGRKWETGLNRGPANMLGLKGEKWGTGLARGHANPVP
jgi:hypothetical protein